jgi:hypothetical protein
MLGLEVEGATLVVTLFLFAVSILYLFASLKYVYFFLLYPMACVHWLRSVSLVAVESTNISFRAHSTCCLSFVFEYHAPVQYLSKARRI